MTIIDSDLSTNLDLVRLKIGDMGATLISDQTINALLTINSENVNKTAIQALQAIVADLAKQVDQEVGDVKIWATGQYKQYKDLLDKYTKDPAYLLSPAVHFLGGVTNTEAARVNGDSDSRSIAVKEGFSSSVSDFSYDSSNPFFLDEI